MDRFEFAERMEEFLQLTQNNFEEKIRSESYDEFSVLFYENAFNMFMSCMENALYDMTMEEEEDA